MSHILKPHPRRKIYFDGYLPPFKWETRKKRLINQTVTVQALQSRFKKGVRLVTRPDKRQQPGSSEAEKQSSNSINPKDATQRHSLRMKFRSKRQSQINDMPKHPFMIPAVIEGLRASENWRDVIQVVPGEADAFCAQDIKQNGGLLLTSDSDLLIQDLGPEGFVVFLWDLRDQTATEAGNSSKKEATAPATDISRALFTATAYNRSNMERHFALGDLGGFPRLIFEWQQRRETLATTHMRLTSDAGIPFDEPAFNEFFEEHRQEDYISETHPVVHKLSNLDPRISEFVIQSLNITMAKDVDTSRSAARDPRGHGELSIFLPTMIEDTSSKSSWECSQTTRQLAYGLARGFSSGDHNSVIEYRTLQSIKGGRMVDVPDSNTTEQWCEMLVSTLTKLDTFPTIRNGKWLAFALYQEIQLSDSQGTNSAAVKTATEAVYQDAKKNQNSWQQIHLNATVQASLYSMRMLSQILEIKSLLAVGRMTDTQRQLLDHVTTLPAIAEWPNVLGLLEDLRSFREAQGFAIIPRILGIPEIKLREPSAKIKKASAQKTKKRTRTESTGPPSKAMRSTNPFDALGISMD